MPGFIAGSYTLQPDATGTSVTMQLAGVQDEQTNSGAHSGSLGFELWYLPATVLGAGGPVSRQQGRRNLPARR